MMFVRFWKVSRGHLSCLVIAFAAAFSVFGAGREFTPTTV